MPSSIHGLLLDLQLGITSLTVLRETKWSAEDQTQGGHMWDKNSTYFAFALALFVCFFFCNGLNYLFSIADNFLILILVEETCKM